MTTKQPESLIEQLHHESGLSRNQIRFWVGQRADPGSPLYNTVFAFKIAGTINPELFTQAWQAVVDNYRVLRLRIREEASKPQADFHPEGSCSLKTADFSSKTDPHAEFQRWSKGRAARALPLAGELVDAVLVDLGENYHGWYLNQHHIITDAVSTIKLVELVFQFYTALNDTSAAPNSGPDYLETIESIQEAGKARLDDAYSHFENRRESHFPRPEFWGRKIVNETTSTERVVLQLTPDESKRLREISSQPPFSSFFQELSLLAGFSTIFSAWLFHVSGQRSFRMDMPMASRSTPGSKEALGLFIEMFPFCVELDEEDTFSTLGKRCLAEAQSLLKACSPGSSFLEHHAASSAVLNYFPQPFKKVDGLDIDSEWIHSGHCDSVHGFRLQVHDYNGTGAFTLYMDFNKACFSNTERERGIYLMRSLITAFIENPEACIGRVPTLSIFDEQALLVDFNSTDGNSTPTKTVIQHFHDQVSSIPDQIALREGPRTLTYAELDNKVAALAASLRERNIGEGCIVPVFMRRSIDAVAGILAVLSTGAAYVPLDPEYPSSRISYILGDCGAALVLTHRGLKDRLAGFTGKILDLDTTSMDAVEGKGAGPTLNQQAYMIYTSGSTGEPKGVPIDHEGLSDYLEWAARQYVRGEQLAFPLFTSLSFDLTVTCLFLPLITGGTLIVYEESNGPVDSAVIDVINDNQVDLIKLTPSHLSLLQQLDLSTSRIRRMILGGEDLKVYLANAITGQFCEPVEIFNEYGPTEAVVGCMIHKFNPKEDKDVSVPIGVPADHVQLYVLNNSLNPVPPGVPGELCISRLGLTRGYHGREQLNAERFVAHPFRKGEKLYRTGDLVRFNQRGLLEYLGRIDRQMKISGFRIEPGEIERCLADHEAVESCVVSSYQPGGSISRQEAVTCCTVCGLPSNYPRATFDEEGVCNTCRSYETVKDAAQAYFKSMEELEAKYREIRSSTNGKYDALVLLSGGKDSTYMLCRMVDMGVRVYSFTLDNGYISEQAKANVRKVVDRLGVDHEFAETPAMDEIFKDSLTRFSNVCNGCFKTIYTLAVNKARKLGIPTILTGLSRGQFFETRLTEDLFKAGRFSPEDIDRAVLEARKAYHRMDDAATRLLDNSAFATDAVFEEVEFVDFYRYCDIGLSDLMTYLKARVGWERPSDTGRSTNCLINDVGIFIHNKERGFHNYALPYSWDVRMGHKTREEALEELNDELEMDSVRDMLDSVGYDEDRLVGNSGQVRMVAYYVAKSPLKEADLRHYLSSRLPDELVPHRFMAIESIPLTPNGKADFSALPHPDTIPGGDTEDFVEPSGPVEEQVAEIWESVIGAGRVSANSNFFQLGGTSLAAMEAMLQICNAFEIDLPLQTIFQENTVSSIAARIEDILLQEISELSEEEAETLAESNPPERD